MPRRSALPGVLLAAVTSCGTSCGHGGALSTDAGPPPDAGSTSDAGHDAGPPVDKSSPPFDAAWRISTHNSYWVDHGVQGDLFASGTQERLADQLLVDHARGVEIDIHKDPNTPGAFDVYHTVPGNSLCGTLPACLAELRAFHYALPDHEAVQVTLELKEITASIFDATHTIDDLDGVLAAELGSLLYRPSDFMSRCPGATTLSACASAAGWPSTHELRGRIVVTPMGNWDGIGAQATKDFIDYATHGDVRDRAGFPMASSWQLDYASLSGTIVYLVTQSELDAAYAQSVFMQVEDTTDPRLHPFLARHGVVRLDGAVSAADQEARAALGAQLLQTDSPWVQADDHGPSQPLRSLAPGFDAGVMTEPGSRFSLGPSPSAAFVFAYRLEAAGASTAWEATLSSGADATRVGCLRAATSIASDDGSLTACRSKTAAARGAEPGTSDGGAPDAEQTTITLSICQAGACQSTEVHSSEPDADGPGDLLRLEVTPGKSGESCVQVRSAAIAGVDLTPRWHAVGAPACFTTPLLYQGIVTPTSAWFFGLRREAAGALADVAAADFTGVVAVPTGDAGAPTDAASLLMDDSAPAP